MRKEFFEALHAEMKTNKDIILVVADLGFGLSNQIKEDMPDQFYNVQAAELAGMGICIGLALSGKIPVMYSITPFLLHRPFEAIKLYLEGEGISVKLVGSGMNDDYKSDGRSHHAFDVDKLLNLTPLIIQIYPKKTDNMSYIVSEMINNNKPTFIGLTR